MLAIREAAGARVGPAAPVNRRSLGFSLTELLIVIAVVGLLVGIGAPQFGQTFAERRVESTTSKLVDLIERARNEAMARHGIVTVRRSGNSWAGDLDAYFVSSGTPNVDRVAPVDIELFTEDLGTLSAEVADSEDSRYLSFNSRGALVGRADTSFRVCIVNGGESIAREIQLSASGFIRTLDAGGGSSC